MLIRSGLGDTADGGGFDLSFLGGSMFTALILGVGIIIAAKTVFEPKARGGAPGRRRTERSKYVKYVARKHKLSKADQQWLMEHSE